MNVHTYKARPSGLAGPAYLDTSFVLDLFGYANPGALGSAGARVRNRIADAHAFYIWARLQQIECFASILTIEEAYSKLIQASYAPYLSKHQLRSWKELRTADPADFALATTASRGATMKLNGFLAGSGIGLVTFGAGRFSSLLAREPRLCRYAKAILDSCESDAMDAFHYAIMRRCRIGLAFASDKDWANFPYGVLVTAA